MIIGSREEMCGGKLCRGVKKRGTTNIGMDFMLLLICLICPGLGRNRWADNQWMGVEGIKGLRREQIRSTKMDSKHKMKRE